MKTSNLQAGDIIVANRFFYKHYGVYAGDGQVIHYTSGSGDFGSDACVRETSLEQFAEGKECSVLQFKESRGRTKPFSSSETLRRARSRLGEKSYNLVFNNCEHFVLWCKLGKNKSVQVEKAFVTAAALLTAAVVVTKLAKDKDEET